MGADYTAYESILKEVWTSKTLEDQLYNGNPFLEAMEKRKPAIVIGDTAQTPIHTGRSGGYSVKPRDGGILNPANKQKVNAASWVWTNHYFQIQIESSTIDETANNSLAAAEVVDTEVTGAVEDMRKQITRQFVGGDGTARIAPVTADGTTTVELEGDGYDALVRGWLTIGQTVDIGTAADQVSGCDSARIVSVEVDAAAPTVTLDETVTSSAADFISIAGARDGTTSYEANGLANIVSQELTVGGIAVADVPNWAAADVDNTSQDLSLAAIASLQEAVFQQTGKSPDWVVTCPKQQSAFYLLIQPQVRFAGDNKLGAGNVGGAIWNGLQVDAQPDVLDRDWWTLTKADLFTVSTEGPVWMPQKYGESGILNWVQGSTAMASAAAYRVQLACSRRNSHAALTNLT